MLILHDVDMRTSMMYDVKLSTEYPVVPPFPLQHAGAGEEGELYARSWSFAQPCVACHLGRVCSVDLSCFCFLKLKLLWFGCRDYIVDEASGVVYYIALDLDEVVRMSTDKVWLMEYLLRRRGSKRWVRDLLLKSMLAAESLPTVARLLKLVNQFYFFINYRVKKTRPEEEALAWDSWGKATEGADAPPPPAGGGEGGGGWLAGVAIVDDHVDGRQGGESGDGGGAAGRQSRGAGGPQDEEEDPVINQAEFYHSVLMPLQDKHTASQESGGEEVEGLTTSYLVAVLLEYIRSLHEHNIKAHHQFYTAVISALTQCSPPRYYQFLQLLQYHVLDDSVEVALKVLGLKDLYPPALQQGIDMLHRLELHNDVVEVLLGEKQVRTHASLPSSHPASPRAWAEAQPAPGMGQVLQALKYQARHPTVSVPRQRYVDAAEATGEEPTIMAVRDYLEMHGQAAESETASQAPPVRSV